ISLLPDEMSRLVHTILSAVFLVFLVSSATGQIDDICSESGINPGLDSPFDHVPYVYGKVVVKGVPAGAKFPRVAVEMEEAGRNRDKSISSRSGYYCF